MIPNVFLRRVLVEDAIPSNSLLHYILYDYHRLISFSLFMLGLLLFVWSLERGSYRYQFQRFAWSLLALIFVCSVPTTISYNVYKGIFWFIFPQFCVITNDCCAYAFGFFFGKTPLIKLSPKKTWEGFLGGMLCTYLLAFFVSMVQWWSIGNWFAINLKVLGVSTNSSDLLIVPKLGLWDPLYLPEACLWLTL